MPLLAAILSQAQAGKGAGVATQAVLPPIPETILETRPEPDQPQDHLSTPPRQQTSDPIAPVSEPCFLLLCRSWTVESKIPPGGASNNYAASSHIPTDVPTGGDFALAHSTSPSRDPFKGKGVAKPSSPI
ncbi:hypothetical protein Tco_0565683 [Tanacetum coccineum]